jgi:hypothetical protein
MKPISSAFAFLVVCICVAVAVPSGAGINAWTSIGPQLPPFYAIESVTIDPSVPDNLWVRTTGGLLYLWRSRDGGLSWEVMTDSTLQSALAIKQVEVDPHDSRHIVALGFAGFCQSFDGGDTWTLHHIGTTTLFFGVINQFAMASNATTIYGAEVQACSRNGGGCSGGGFWKSTNAGVTWTLLSLKNQTVGQIAADPFNADTVYAIVYQASTTTIGAGTLMRSRDGGRNWIALSPRACTDADISCSAGAAYLLVEPTSASTLYFRGDDDLLVSHDGGDTWTKTLPDKNFPLPVSDPFESGLLYADLGNEPTPPTPPPGPPPPPLPNELYGVVRSSDYGQTWSPVISTSTGNLQVDSRRSFYGASSKGLFRYTLVVPRRRSVKP